MDDLNPIISLRIFIVNELLELKDKKQRIQFKKAQKNQVDIFPKKTSRCPINTGRDAQHHSSSRKCK